MIRYVHDAGSVAKRATGLSICRLLGRPPFRMADRRYTMYKRPPALSRRIMNRIMCRDLLLLVTKIAKRHPVPLPIHQGTLPFTELRPMRCLPIHLQSRRRPLLKSVLMSIYVASTRHPPADVALDPGRGRLVEA